MKLGIKCNLMKINLQFQTNNHEGRDDTPVMRSTCADYKISKNTKKKSTKKFKIQLSL